MTDPEHASYPIVIGIARPGSVSVVDFEPQVRGKCLDLDHATIEAPHSPADYEVVGDSCLSKTTKLTLRHKPHS